MLVSQRPVPPTYSFHLLHYIASPIGPSSTYLSFPVLNNAAAKKGHIPIERESLLYLAHGSSAVVYAIDETTVYKEYYDQGDDDLITERRALQRLSHRNIVRYLGDAEKWTHFGAWRGGLGHERRHADAGSIFGHQDRLDTRCSSSAALYPFPEYPPRRLRVQ